MLSLASLCYSNEFFAGGWLVVVWSWGEDENEIIYYALAFRYQTHTHCC
jgi:hypothetical protein